MLRLFVLLFVFCPLAVIGGSPSSPSPSSSESVSVVATETSTQQTHQSDDSASRSLRGKEKPPPSAPTSMPPALIRRKLSQMSSLRSLLVVGSGSLRQQRFRQQPSTSSPSTSSTATATVSSAAVARPSAADCSEELRETGEEVVEEMCAGAQGAIQRAEKLVRQESDSFVSSVRNQVCATMCRVGRGIERSAECVRSCVAQRVASLRRRLASLLGFAADGSQGVARRLSHFGNRGAEALRQRVSVPLRKLSSSFLSPSKPRHGRKGH
uniref:Tim10-like domain-containing protein n=1 Tax=Chromera velia CCMP2878 TaxID=1169474 RepID=A0A0G4I9M1_9ALVE|eukprot:Cvel_2061.t1-p1 / transcript=Cvel_2061.t1 / gene=Cvel_2061 / organism=Chromera_velia_CCMP2878 / gene_product=hypothetical protein / transcript_product=hypothetical protein / location=Cvel_scaffold79:96054-96933(+) / protein_length=267 / sequence_SO=supercontig / SO=protein_coding / is_pseudo=false